MWKRIELRVGQVVTAIKRSARCTQRRIVGLVNDAKFGELVGYNTGGDRHYYCTRTTFLRWIRQQRKQKKRRHVPADLFSVQPGA